MAMETGPFEDVDVFKNRGTPQWMVNIMENPIKIDDLFPLFLETPMYFQFEKWGNSSDRYVIVYQREKKT